MPGPDYGYAVATDGGHAYVAGRLSRGGDRDHDAWIARYRVDGDLVWEHPRAESVGMSDDAIDVALAPDGDIIIVGNEVDPTTGLDSCADGWIMRLSPDGTERWHQPQHRP